MKETGCRLVADEGMVYTVEVAKGELDWLRAYENLFDVTHCIFRDNLEEFAEKAVDYDSAQANAACSALGKVCKLLFRQQPSPMLPIQLLL